MRLRSISFLCASLFSAPQGPATAVAWMYAPAEVAASLSLPPRAVRLAHVLNREPISFSARLKRVAGRFFRIR